MKINFGYCCISTLNPKLRCNSVSTKTYLDKHSSEQCKAYLKTKADKNIYNLYNLPIENNENNINVFRIPEQLLPQIDLYYYPVSEYKEKLKEIGKLANSFDMQLSSHASEYCILNSKKQDVVQNTINRINLYSEMFEYMELKKTPNMTIHVGVKSAYNSIDDAIDVFCKSFNKLSDFAKKILVIENDQNNYTIDDCLNINSKIGIPVVFDNRHFHWNKGSLDYNQAVKKCLQTWGKRIPKLHLSSESDYKMHSHDKFINVNDYFEMEHALNNTSAKEVNIMLECKEKDIALIKLREDLKKLEMI